MCHCPEPVPAAPEPVDRVPALVAALKGKDRATRLKAIDELGKMGSDAGDAVPELIELMEEPDEEMRFVLCIVLQEIGPKSVPSLVCALASREPSRRRHAAEALAQIAGSGDTRPLVAPTLPILLAVATQDSDPQVRMAATDAIAAVGNKEAMTALLAILKDHDDDVRRARS